MSGGETIELNRSDDRDSDWRVILTVVSGPHQGRHWTFDRATRLTIGRAAPANIRLGQEASLSQCHCELQIAPPSVHLVDLESTNGTEVNGVRVAEALMTDGDEFGVGETSIAVRAVRHPRPAVTNSAERASPDRPSPVTDPSKPAINPTRAVRVARQRPSLPPRDLLADPILNHGRPSPTGRQASSDAVGETRHMGHDPPINTDPSPEATIAEGNLPATLGAYELGPKVGQGGMAVVYAARHRKTLQPVAIKVIRSSVAPSDKMVQLFVREASLLLQLRHSRVVRCIEFGFQENRPFLVMEWVDTLDLLKLVDEQPPERRVRMGAWVISRVLQALGHAHSLGIVHRDVKPGNILASRDGRHLQVKLADFGLAKCYEDAGFSAMTDDHSVRGTLAYMAPEQMKEARSVGPPADIFAAGACLYRLIAGQHPKITAEGIVCDPRVLAAAEIPEPLVRVIARSMARDPQKRFRDASAMARALQPFHGKSS